MRRTNGLSQYLAITDERRVTVTVSPLARVGCIVIHYYYIIITKKRQIYPAVNELQGQVTKSIEAVQENKKKSPG